VHHCPLSARRWSGAGFGVTKPACLAPPPCLAADSGNEAMTETIAPSYSPTDTHSPASDHTHNMPIQAALLGSGIFAQIASIPALSRSLDILPAHDLVSISCLG
jgi:hypothetical protein